ncbi:hypothetical protein J3U66_00255 [Gilliamella sp. B2969]|uniref:T6SS effector BTH_I2691 family protein n=1 Tax=Gilliamella sp. B2969 TaxID=2818021 RepID=UPI002269E157|nr:T6SS effector BTH_I2691 family protein [Gilliamella sp. B2969]MCX8728808.1 hypothetical protein [Gilliamella sp. B2969]
MTDSNKTSNCGCQTQGIAILPVRYTVVPKYLKSTQPHWANSSNVINLPLTEGYQYHVRTLREGFLYLYIPDKLGSKWQIYSIDSKGHIIKQPSNNTAQPIADSEQNADYHCPTITSNPCHDAFITLAYPEHLTKVYFAFSENRWSENTIQKYEKNPEQRMQMIDLSHWEGNAESATTANLSNIRSILDFDPNVDREQLPYDENRQLIFSKDNKNGQNGVKFNDTFSQNRDKQYQFDKTLLDKNSTCEPWGRLTSDSSEHLAKTLAKYSPSKKPMIIAIEDPIGITTELNGYYNDSYVRVLQFQQERRLEYEALACIEHGKYLAGLKKFSDDYSFPPEEYYHIKHILKSGKIDDNPDRPMTNTRNGLVALIRNELYGKAGSYDYFHKFESFCEANLDTPYPELTIYDIYVNREGLNASRGQQVPPILSETEKIKVLQSNLVQKYTNTLKDFYNQESALKAKREKDTQQYLKKYDELVNTKPFEDRQKELLELVDKKYQSRSKQLITWIKDSNFYSTVYHDLDGNQLYDLDEDFHPKIKEYKQTFESVLQESLKHKEITPDDLEELRKVNIEGIIFFVTITHVTQGLELCEQGKTFLDAFKNFDYAKTTNDNINGMLWRMFAYHNDDMQSMINQVLDEAAKPENKSTIETQIYKLMAKLDNLPFNKIALKFKRVQDVLLTLDELRRNDPLGRIKENLFSVKLLGIPITLKIKGLTFGESKLLEATKLLQPIFDRIANSLYHASTVIYKVLSLTTAGVLKTTAKTYLHLEFQLIAALINLDPGPNFGTAKIPLYHPRWKLATRMAVNKARTLLNDAIVNLDRRVNITFNRTLSQTKANKVFHFIFKASDADLGISKNLSTSLKSMRMSAVVAMFELYNFNSISKTNPNLEKDEFYSNLKTSAGFALAAASVELMAMITAVTKGMRNVFFSLGKALSGVLGGIASFLMIPIASNKLSESEKISLTTLYSFKIFLLILIGGATLLIGLSYRFVWCRSFLTSKMMLAIFEKVGKHIGVKKVASIVAVQLVLMRSAGWLGLALMVFDFAIDYFSDDNFETWLKRCALRTDKYLMPHNKFKIYQTPEQQSSAYQNDVLKDMFNIDDKPPTDNNQANKDNTNSIDVDEALALIEQDLQKRGFIHVETV